MARQAILGISAFYHDSAAALLVDGQIAAAAQEERFSRTRHDASFPTQRLPLRARRSRRPLRRADGGGVLRQAVPEIRAAARDLPRVRSGRSLQFRHGHAGLDQGEAVHAPAARRRTSASSGRRGIASSIPEHHLSHAASAFYPSPFDEAAILTIDGVGEWATTTIGRGRGRDVEILSELHFPHSVGLLYSAFTYYLGFTVNSGEYKLMGLAPYGHAGSARVRGFADTIRRELVDVRPDGSLVLNMAHFEFATGLRMVHEASWERLFGLPRRASDVELTQAHMDLALAIQQVTEDIVLRLARTARTATGCRHLVMAGGVALNCVANGKLLESGLFDDIWIQPAAGDAGGAVGAAYAAWHIHRGEPRSATGGRGTCDAMAGSYLGPQFSDLDIERTIRGFGARASRAADLDALVADVAGRLAAGQVGGWFQGRMEFGPRALGNRSIIGDARNPEMQKRLNLKVKFREGFRPFAPSVLEEDAAEHFELDRPSPYMLLVAPGASGAAARRSRRRCSRHRSTTGCTSSVRTCPRSRTWTTRRASRP